MTFVYTLKDIFFVGLLLAVGALFLVVWIADKVRIVRPRKSTSKDKQDG